MLHSSLPAAVKGASKIETVRLFDVVASGNERKHEAVWCPPKLSQHVSAVHIVFVAAVVCSGVVHLQHGDRFRVVLEIQKRVKEKETLGSTSCIKLCPAEY